MPSVSQAVLLRHLDNVHFKQHKAAVKERLRSRTDANQGRMSTKHMDIDQKHPSIKNGLRLGTNVDQETTPIRKRLPSGNEFGRT